MSLPDEVSQWPLPWATAKILKRQILPLHFWTPMLLAGGLDSQTGNRFEEVHGQVGGGRIVRGVEWVHSKLIEQSASCTPCICWDAVNSVWGFGGHEPPAPEQEASPQGQLLPLKGPTHPWLNVPGLPLSSGGCLAHAPPPPLPPPPSPLTSSPNRARQGTCPMLKEQRWQLGSMYAWDNVPVNLRTDTVATCTLCPLHQSILPSLPLPRKEALLFMFDPPWELKDVRDLSAS